MKNQVQKSIKKMIHFDTHFWSILDQFWEPKSTKNGPKTGSKTRAILSRRRTRVHQPLGPVPGRRRAPWAAPKIAPDRTKKPKTKRRRGETKGKGNKRTDVPRQICHAWGPRPGEFVVYRIALVFQDCSSSGYLSLGT